MYGILCATPEERDALRARLRTDPTPQRLGPTEVWTGDHDGQPFALALSGIGKVNAAAAATLLLAMFDADVLVFAGVAGGLNPNFKVGDVLLGERLGVHDFGLMAEGAFTSTRSGLIPIGAPALTELHPVSDAVRENLTALRDRVAPLLPARVRLGTIATADYFLNCRETRDALHSSFAADAMDMESGAVFQIAEDWRAPLYVIRTLSDLAGEDSHLTYPEMAALAARNSALCVTELLDLLAAQCVAARA
ncbi:5'-methylthioadenosine/S-adenosylhomocysteine nucleosidase [Phenylobacterium aquaticum]|uniref:5'-methylthioadenosine/S-adenosylhomocysteine nucleosidase n=1 Tax=Phenylobacterium aquaticum TaxID=1763816 RepID=UPI0026F21918|nr:5'-methylthioadenosine/S-adenosylhomocysteine nucleosidase [Phenylobacterium aquaticum]